MKIISITLTAVVMILITLYEWPRINEDMKKERRTFIVLAAGGFLLAVILIIFPDMPGPSEFSGWLLKPVRGLLEG